MTRIVFITPADARYGFSLAGADQRIAAPDDAEALLRAALGEEEAGVVVIDERLLAQIPEERFREMEERWYGVLLVLPAPEREGGEGEDHLSRLIRRVLGYQVRLQP